LAARTKGVHFKVVSVRPSAKYDTSGAFEVVIKQPDKDAVS